MNKPIFIVGCDRSGTTLLRLMLNQSPELWIPNETKFAPVIECWEREWGTTKFQHDFQVWFFIRDLLSNNATSKTTTGSAFNLSAEEIAGIGDMSPVDSVRAVDSIFSYCAARAGKNRWGDKTPHHVMSMKSLEQLFPDAVFVHIIRDPRDVAMSIVNAGWCSDIPEAIDFWEERVTAGRSAGKILGSSRYLETRYEDLVTDPVKTLKKISDFAGINYVDQMLEYHKHAKKDIPAPHQELFEKIDKPVQSSNIDKWRNSICGVDIRYAQTRNTKQISELNFTDTGTRLRFSDMAFIKLRRHIKSKLNRLKSHFLNRTKMRR